MSAKTPAVFVNRFVRSAPFIYPLNTSENRFLMFNGVEKGITENKWVKKKI